MSRSARSSKYISHFGSYGLAPALILTCRRIEMPLMFNQLYNFSSLSTRRECPSGSRRRPVTTCDPTTTLIGMTTLRPLP